MIHDIWSQAYALEVQSLSPDDDDFKKRHDSAVSLYSQLLLECHSRITLIEQAARARKHNVKVMGLSEMRQRIRQGARL